MNESDIIFYTGLTEHAGIRKIQMTVADGNKQ